MDLMKTLTKRLNEKGYDVDKVKEYNEKFKCVVIERKTGFRFRVEVPKSLQLIYMNRFINVCIIDCIDVAKLCGFKGD